MILGLSLQVTLDSLDLNTGAIAYRFRKMLLLFLHNCTRGRHTYVSSNDKNQCMSLVAGG